MTEAGWDGRAILAGAGALGIAGAEAGRHGFGLGRDKPAVAAWPDLTAAFLRRHGV